MRKLRSLFQQAHTGFPHHSTRISPGVWKSRPATTGSPAEGRHSIHGRVVAHARNCSHRLGSFAGSDSGRPLRRVIVGIWQDFHRLTTPVQKYWLHCGLDSNFQCLHTGFPQLEWQFSNRLVEIHAGERLGQSRGGTPIARATAHAWVSRAYSLRLARRARYSRASFASRRRSLVSNIAFLTMRHAARGRK